MHDQNNDAPEKRPALIRLLHDSYRRNPIAFSFTLMGVSILAIIIGAWMTTTATA